MNNELNPDEIIWIGKNDHKYIFGICRIGDAWHGFARGDLKPPKTAMIFFFAFDSVKDKTEALKKTVAYAFMPEHMYGGISQWAPDFVADADVQNARAEDFPCGNGHPLCDGDCSLFRTIPVNLNIENGKNYE